MKTFDAQNKSLGRVASDVARELMGKNEPDYKRHVAPSVPVKVINLSKISMRPGRDRTTSHVRYTGYPGGLRTQTLEHAIQTKGYAEVFRRAVYGMLPGNKLRPLMMKQLILEE